MQIFVLFKLCAITTMIACLVDMLVTRSIQNFNFLSRFTSDFRENEWSRHMFWRWFGLIAGKDTMNFMSSRALFFPIAEVILPLALTTSFDLYGWSLLILPNLVFSVFVILIAVVNLRTHYIPHAVSRPGILLGIVLGMVHGWGGLLNAALGALVGFGIFFALYQLGNLVVHYRARRLGIDNDEEAMGGGVVYAATLTGAYCGFPHALNALVFAILIGGLISMLVILYRALDKRSPWPDLNAHIDYGDIIVIGGAVYTFLLPLFS